MKKVATILCIFLLPAGLPNAHAQSISPGIVNSAGGTGIIGSNDFDWSIGEMTMVSTFTSSSVIVTQGVLQPADTTTATGISNNNITDNLLVFPNPASTTLNIQYSATAQGRLSYRFMDIAGKTLISYTIEVKQGINTERLNISCFAAAVYMLEISTPISGKPEMASYKIEKLK